MRKMKITLTPQLIWIIYKSYIKYLEIFRLNLFKDIIIGFNHSLKINIESLAILSASLFV